MSCLRICQRITGIGLGAHQTECRFYLNFFHKSAYIFLCSLREVFCIDDSPQKSIYLQGRLAYCNGLCPPYVGRGQAAWNVRPCHISTFLIGRDTASLREGTWKKKKKVTVNAYFEKSQKYICPKDDWCQGQKMGAVRPSVDDTLQCTADQLLFVVVVVIF